MIAIGVVWILIVSAGVALDVNAEEDTEIFEGMWTNMPMRSPSARYGTVMAYDSENDRVILFGGYTGSSNGETWAYDDSATVPEFSIIVIATVAPAVLAGIIMAKRRRRPA